MTEIILTSSILIVLLAALRRVLRGRISPCLQYALWLLVAARLLIPGTLFNAPVSVLGAAAELRSAVRLEATGPYTPDEAPIPHMDPVGPQQSAATKPVGDAAGLTETSLSDLPHFSMEELRQRDWPHIVWKAGMAVVGSTLVVSNLVFYLRLRKNRKRLVLPAAPWSGKLPVYEADALPSSCLFGFFRPAIYLNGAAMDAEHPEHILAHEYAHYRHGDYLWTILRSFCLVVHWYNPLVWWAAAMSRQDCELACDAAVLRRLDEKDGIDYGQTLLSMVSRSRNPAALLHTATTMSAGKRAMKERITLIIKQPKMRKITMLAVVLLACLLAACTFSGNPAETPADPGPADDAPSQAVPVSVTVSQVYSSYSGDTSLITDPDEVARLWALYQGFEYEGSYDPTGMGGWAITVQFQFGDEPDDADVSFFLTGHGIYTQDGESLLLKDIDKIYEEFLRASTSNPVTSDIADADDNTVPAVEPAVAPEPQPETETLPELDPGHVVMMENARSIVAQIQAGADISEWLPLMNYMDWSLLAQAAEEAGMENGDGITAVVEIIGDLTLYVEENGASMPMAEYLYILSATDGLDGAPAEGYSALIYEMYCINPGQFAYVVLNQLPEEQQGIILDFLRVEIIDMAYNYSYELRKAGKDRPSREEMIHLLEADLAESLSQQITDITFRGPGESAQYRFIGVQGVGAATFESEDPEIATVNEIGLIVAVAPGETTINVHYEGAGGPFDAACTIHCDW